MKTIEGIIKSSLFWFGSFLMMFLCFTVLTAVITGLTGDDFQISMYNMRSVYCFVSFFISSISTYLYAKEIKLIQPESILNKDTQYDFKTDKKDVNIWWYSNHNDLK